MKKRNLTPWLQKHTWAVRPYAFLWLVISPIAFPVMAVMECWGDITDAYVEVFDALINGVEEE